MELSLSQIFNILLKRFKWIIGATLVLGVLAFTITTVAIQPTYTSSVQLYVNSKEAGKVNSNSSSLNDLNFSQKVVATYIQFLSTNAFMDKIIAEGDVSYTTNQLKSCFSIIRVGETEIFQINVKTTDAKLSLKIANAAAKVAPEMIQSVNTGAGEVRVVDPARLATSPSSPNIKMNTAIGLLIGLALSALLSIGIELFDVRVKTVNDLLKFELPILATIPQLVEGEQGNEKGKKSTQKKKR